MKIKYFLILTLCFFQFSISQSTQENNNAIEPRYLIDKPTAGMLQQGSFSLNLDFFQEGGSVVYLNTAVTPKLSFGISFGGNNIIGDKNVKWNKSAGVNVKYRIVEEEEQIPAIAIGFDSQGKDAFLVDSNRYMIKSPGFFIVASENIDFLGYLSIHGGINKSLEDDDDKDVNGFIGLEKTLGDDFSFVAEYDFGFNDNDNKSFNTGLRFSLSSGFCIGVNLKKIKTEKKFEIGNRTLFVEYIKTF